MTSNVTNVRIAESSGNSDLDEAAIRAARRWKFDTPNGARQGSQPKLILLSRGQSDRKSPRTSKTKTSLTENAPLLLKTRQGHPLHLEPQGQPPEQQLNALPQLALKKAHPGSVYKPRRHAPQQATPVVRGSCGHPYAASGLGQRQPQLVREVTGIPT